jgi:zinc protease
MTTTRIALLTSLLLVAARHPEAVAAPDDGRASLAPLQAGLPSGQRYELDSGLTVVLLPNDGNPYLDMQLGFRAGGGLDPAGKEGLASLLGRMLSTGIPGRDEAALAAELALLGGWIGPDPGMESFVLGGQIPTLSEADVRRFLDIFVAIARSPTLPAALVEREKTLRFGLLRRVLDNPEALANIAAKLAAFGNNPFGFAGYGTFSSVAAITREDIADLHAALFDPPSSLPAPPWSSRIA